MDRIKILQEKIHDCALVTSDINRRYFTGMRSSAGTLLVFPDAAYLIIDFRYIEKAKKTVRDCEVILQKPAGGLYEQINELCTKHGAKEISIENENTTLAQVDTLSKKLDCKLDVSGTLSEIISTLRLIKTPDEIEKIIAAQRIAEKGFEHMLEFVRPGRTEREIQLELDFFMLKNGAEALSFDTIALSGANTSLPHGVPSDKKVQNGELVLLDFGAVVDGYHSDMTRTFAVGEPGEKARGVYDIVLNAQKRALAAAKAGMTGAELDAAAREYIASNGFGENFGHSLGHGVGMEIHEPPTASATSRTVLTDGMIVTIEPGIYIEGEFGVRIEDFVIIRDNGCENMTQAEKELIVV